jgi:hypothetical protein
VYERCLLFCVVCLVVLLGADQSLSLRDCRISVYWGSATLVDVIWDSMVGSEAFAWYIKHSERCTLTYVEVSVSRSPFSVGVSIWETVLFWIQRRATFWVNQRERNGRVLLWAGQFWHGRSP